MKTFKILLLFAAVFNVPGVNAQSTVGLRAGINVANITKIQEFSGPDLNKNSITGMNFAVFTELGISHLFAIQPEFNFLQKGTVIKGKDIEGMSDVRFKVVANYVEVPVLAKFRFGTNKVRAFAHAGPSVGYATGGRAIIKIDGEKSSEKIEFDNNINDDGMRDQRWDVSAIVGAGGTMLAGPGNIVLDLRYGLDFTDFTKFKDSAPGGYQKSFNRGFGISVGYQIPLAKV